MKTTKKLSLVVLAGLFSALASFGLYVLMPYLSGEIGSSVNDGDSKLASNARWALQPEVEERPELVPRHEIVNQVAEAKQDTFEESEESSTLAKNEEGLAPVNPVEEESEKTPEGRVLAYRGSEGGHPFSVPKGLEEADLIPRLKGLIEEEDDDESREKPDKTKSKNPGGKDLGPTVEPKPHDRVPTSNGPGRVAGAKVNVSRGGLVAGAQIDVESPEAQAPTALQTNPAVPTPSSKLRSRVGSNGRVFIGGGWYSNGAAGNVNGLLGGSQNPTTTQPITIDSRGISGVSLHRNNQITGLPLGVESGGPVGFRSVIQNSSNATIRGGSIIPANSGVTPTSPDSRRPVAPSDLPSTGVSDGRINVGGIKLP